MEVVFFIYGLAFFMLGFAILYYPKKNSTFRLADKIHLVGWFGILHGINEWLDMLILIRALDTSFAWETARLLTLPASFLVLVYFGAETISTQKKNCFACKYLTLVLAVLWAVLFLAGGHNSTRWDVLSRYVLCFPGAMLTGMGLFAYMPETKNSRNFRLAVNLKVAGAAFIVYAFIAGIIVNDAAFFPPSFLNYSLFSKSLGVPVQVFRGLCAVVIAYNLVRVLKIFHLEMQQSLQDSEMRFRTVVNTAPVTFFIEDKNHCVTFLEGKGLANLDIMHSEAIGKPISQVFAGLPRIYQGSEQAFSSGEKFSEIISDRGHFYEAFFAPLKNETGVASGAIGVVIDISEQKNAQNDLDKYRIEMEKNKTLAAIGALSSEIARETAGPLHESKVSLLKALSGLRKTIGAGDVKASIQEGLDKISGAIKALGGFCVKANLQTLPQAEPIDLFEIVQRVLSVFRESAQHAMVRITTERMDIFPVMNISSRELEQVIYTMVQNVIQSADGTHVHDLSIDFSIQKETFCMKFFESCMYDSVQNPEELSTLKTEMLAGRGERSFGFSVLKGIIDTFSGTIAISPNSQGGIIYEIHLPLAR
jgi:PAS domain-containing protein